MCEVVCGKSIVVPVTNSVCYDMCCVPDRKQVQTRLSEKYARKTVDKGEGGLGLSYCQGKRQKNRENYICFSLRVDSVFS